MKIAETTEFVLETNLLYEGMDHVQMPVEVLGRREEDSILAMVPGRELHRIGANPNDFRKDEEYSFLIGIEVREVAHVG